MRLTAKHSAVNDNILFDFGDGATSKTTVNADHKLPKEPRSILVRLQKRRQNQQRTNLKVQVPDLTIPIGAIKTEKVRRCLLRVQRGQSRDSRATDSLNRLPP
jgi:hypothetical protein